MSLQKIPIETLQKIRQHIKDALLLPESENHPKVKSFEEDEDLPEPDSLGGLGDLFNTGGLLDEATHTPNNQGRWFISTADPGGALLKLPGLSLNPEFRLVCYLLRLTDDGIGTIWAIPKSLSTTFHLEQALRSSGDRTHPPQPEGALADVMEAVSGDRTPISFVVASILSRELQELGALGKSCNWSHHRFINTLPAQLSWEWKTEAPQDLSPKLRVLDNGKAAVEFFTCRVAPPVAIFRHIDQYLPEHYKATQLDQPVAIGRKAGSGF